MPHPHSDQTQIMQKNLQQLLKNQNYFSCFIQSSKKQQQPTNPFQKRLFDKNLRRSAISCGHQNSNNHLLNDNLEESHRLTSSRRNSLVHNSQALLQYHNPPTLSQSNLYTHIISHPKPPTTSHKISLARSRHSDPLKHQLTQIINNFRLQLDYLQQKLHHKVDQLNIRYGDRECNQKQKQAQFMVESLQKIVGFMVENCVNLQDSVMYGERNQEDIGRRRSEIMTKEVYQIREDQNQRQNEEKVTFNYNNHHSNTVDQYKQTHRFQNKNFNQKDKASVKKRKIIGMMDKENMNSNNKNYQEENMPQTYYINNKLHTNIQHTNNIKPTYQFTNKPSKQPTRPTNQPSQKSTTKRTLSKTSNQKLPQTITQNDPYHYHSSKQPNPNHSHSNNTSSHNESNHCTKSIYETVLEEREQRLKMMKKKIV